MPAKRYPEVDQHQRMTVDPLTQSLVEMELAAGAPHSQEACCRLAARVSIAKYGVPRDDDEFRGAAAGGAAGLFGPAFVSADDDQRKAWVDMYEAALKKVCAEKSEN